MPELHPSEVRRRRVAWPLLAAGMVVAAWPTLESLLWQIDLPRYSFWIVAAVVAVLLAAYYAFLFRSRAADHRAQGGQRVEVAPREVPPVADEPTLFVAGPVRHLTTGDNWMSFEKGSGVRRRFYFCVGVQDSYAEVHVKPYDDTPTVEAGSRVVRAKGRDRGYDIARVVSGAAPDPMARVLRKAQNPPEMALKGQWLVASALPMEVTDFDEWRHTRGDIVLRVAGALDDDYRRRTKPKREAAPQRPLDPARNEWHPTPTVPTASQAVQPKRWQQPPQG